MKLAIQGGKVYDPANGVDGVVKTICIEDGRVVEEPAEGFKADRKIDATGRVVMPGGVDMHCHIAGPSVNRARRLIASDSSLLSQTNAEWPIVPTTESTGQRYGLLGYTTAIEAAIAPSGARQCHLEFADTPILDRGFLLLLANHELLFDLLERDEDELARGVVAWLLHQTGSFGIKGVNPGGVSHWLSTAEALTSFSAPLPGRKISPRRIVEFLAHTADTLQLPHPLHLHVNQLGVPGNIAVTLETSRALSGHRHHLAHVQFHSYGEDESGDFTSGAERFIEHLHANPEVTADVGQVMFGDALTLTADAEVEYFLWKLTGKPYVNVEVDLETGCGIIPVEYRNDSRMHTMQWAIGLELFLLCNDPWRLPLSTDHPNGGSFLAYPTLIAQLMDRGLREAAIERANPKAMNRCRLKEMDREYTLNEIAIITRAAPARILGLANKGHLGPGADADVTIYNDTADREAMFRWPQMVIKGGEILVEDGELRRSQAGRTLVVEPSHDDNAERYIRQWYERHGTFDPRQMAVGPGLRSSLETIGQQSNE